MPYILLEDGTSRILLEDGTSLLLMEEPATTDWTGTGSLSVTPTLTGAGVQNKTGTGALAVTATLTGAGVQNKTGTGALSVSATLTASGAHGWGGTGALAYSASVSGSGTVGTSAVDYSGTGALSVAATIAADASTTAQPDATVDSPGGGGGGRHYPWRRRYLKYDDEALAQELAYVHHFLRGEVASNDEEPKPTVRKVVRKLRQVAHHVQEAAREDGVAAGEALERIAAVQAATDAAIARIHERANEKYLRSLLETRALLERLWAEAAEMDDEEAILLLL